MAQNAAQQETAGSDTPLDTLAALLKDDMRAVNSVILARMQSDVPVIPQLAGYLIAAGGKRIRPLLTLASTRLFSEDGVLPYNLAAAVEFIHTATLLHDDVVDESKQRRGKDAANLVFGNQTSVLVGDFLFSRAFQLMVESGSIEVLRILSEASAVITEGEVMQLTTANNLNTTLDEYYTVIGAKTAALFAAACEVGPVHAGEYGTAQKAMRDYGYNLGMAFQIADDILDYSADRQALGKTVGDDFREGKITAPILLALENANDEERAFWQRTLAEKDQKDGDFETACTILEKHDAFTRSHDLAGRYCDAAHDALTRAAETDGPYGTALYNLVDYVIGRGS